MRNTIGALLLVVVAGCQDDNRRLDDNAAQLDALRAEVASLKAQLGTFDPGVGGPSLQMSLAAVGARLEVVEAQLAKVTAPKVPHLVAFAGTDREVDLGVGAPGSRCAWNATAGGEVCFDRFAPVWFALADCKGEAFVQSDPNRSSQLLLAPDGRAFRDTRSPVETMPRSGMPSPGKCEPQPPNAPTMWSPLVEVAAFPQLTVGDLSLALR